MGHASVTQDTDQTTVQRGFVWLIADNMENVSMDSVNVRQSIRDHIAIERSAEIIATIEDSATTGSVSA